MTPDVFPANQRVIDLTTERYFDCGIQKVEELIQQKPWYRIPPQGLENLYCKDINRLASELSLDQSQLDTSDTGVLYSDLSTFSKQTLRAIQRASSVVLGSMFLLEHKNYRGSTAVYRSETEDPIKVEASMEGIRASIYKTGVRFSPDSETLYGLPDFFIVRPNGYTFFYDAHISTGSMRIDDNRRHLGETRRTASEKGKQKIFKNALAQRTNFPFMRPVFDADMYSVILTNPVPGTEHWDIQNLGYDCVVYAGMTSLNKTIVETVQIMRENLRS